MIRVTVNLEPLTRFAASLSETTKEGGPIHDALKQWARRYRGFLRERFDSFSKGGGDWKPLAKGTILARRAGRGKGKTQKTRRQERRRLQKRESALLIRAQKAWAAGQYVRAQGLRRQAESASLKRQSLGTMAGLSILRDTGTLFSALDPTFSGKPGQLEEAIPFGVRVGYGGPHAHPKGKATIADIAAAHQEGAGNLPARRIIVDPSEGLIAAMAGDMDRAVRRLARDAGAD